MFPLTRLLSLAAAATLVALIAANIPVRADDPDQRLGPVGQPHEPVVTDCHLLRRAISRRACQARLRPVEHVESAESK